MQVMRRIVDDHWHIKYPTYISPAAKDLVSKLLERKPAKRIGAVQESHITTEMHAKHIIYILLTLVVSTTSFMGVTAVRGSAQFSHVNLIGDNRF